MNLKYYYWYFQSVLPESFCNDLIKYGNEKQEETALTGGYQTKSDKGETLSETELKDLKKKRDSNIVWLNDQIKMLVGILNGIGQSLVSLQNINKINIMVGIVILGMNHTMI